MQIKKKDLLEIIDSNGDLIGKNDVPTNGSDLESAANNTTDYNQKIGTQPFRYDLLGRFGFFPFMEGKTDETHVKLMQDLINLMFDRYKEIMKFYFKNPNKLKSDYRKINDGTADPQKEVNIEYANKIMRLFDVALKSPDNIDEAAVVEDKMFDKKNEDEISGKSEDKEVREKKIEKIAGLINKLEKKDIDKLINLLERKK